MSNLTTNMIQSSIEINGELYYSQIWEGEISLPTASNVEMNIQMEIYAHRRNVILGIIKTQYNIVKTRPSNVNWQYQCNCNGAHSCVSSTKVPTSRIYYSFHFF